MNLKHQKKRNINWIVSNLLMVNILDVILEVQKINVNNKDKIIIFYT